MTVESYLTRELDIRFVDARKLVNEAKLNLKLHGYTNKDQEPIVQREALRLFQERDVQEQSQWKQANWDLEAAKIPNGSISLSGWQDSSTNDMNESGHSTLSNFTVRSLCRR